ncbi:recombinase family protein [Actinocorallia libanotica]|uniref:Resolvase/invertase-type recombinase catalytic domain-containing protein n=1 Tax=Actinocorallia libanotica TaxID=46162 RepID=A0ABN1RCZ7_9ACTN
MAKRIPDGLLPEELWRRLVEAYTAGEEGCFAVRGDAAREFTRLDVYRRPTPEGPLVDRRVPDGREPRGTYAFINDAGHAHVLANAARYRSLYPDVLLTETAPPAPGRVYAYVRVSTRDQNPQLQLDAITASGYDRLFTEALSGKRGVDRPQWRELLTVARRGDTVKFWKSDRWGRSAAHVLATVNELRDRGVRVVSLTEDFDLDTKEGRLMFGVLALAAEYELELRAERQADGIAAAQRREAEGRRLPGKKKTGRPSVIGPAELATLHHLVNDGVSVTEAARTLKISRSTAYAALATNPA